MSGNKDKYTLSVRVLSCSGPQSQDCTYNNYYRHKDVAKHVQSSRLWKLRHKSSFLTMEIPKNIPNSRSTSSQSSWHDKTPSLFGCLPQRLKWPLHSTHHILIEVELHPVTTRGVKIHRFESVSVFYIKDATTSISGPLYRFRFTINWSITRF